MPMTEEEDDARSTEPTDANRRSRHFKDEIRPQIARRHTEDFKRLAASVYGPAAARKDVSITGRRDFTEGLTALK